MAKKAKSKKRAIAHRKFVKKQFGYQLIIYFGVLFFLIFLLVYLFIHPLGLQSKKQIVPTPQRPVKQQLDVVINPPTKPSPTPHSNPQNFGRSVNVPILYYHYIGNNPNPLDTARNSLEVTPDKFAEQMSYLSSSGFNPISLDTLYAALYGRASLPAKPIVLTFDDGYVDFYQNAYPILKQNNFHATEFIPTGLINQGYYLSWDQIKEMDASGLISFQAHSVNHPNMASLNIDQVKYQVIESKKALQDTLNKPVNFFAYPYGASNELTWNTVKDAGFIGAVGTWYGTIESEGNIYDMPRIRVGSNWTINDFANNI